MGAVLFAAINVLGFDGIVVVNDSVTLKEITPAQVKDILTGKTMYWEGGQSITLVVPGNSSDVAIQAASGMGPSQFRTHWQRLAFSGRGSQPKKTEDAAKAVAAVKASRGAFCIVPPGTDTTGVKKLELKK